MYNLLTVGFEFNNEFYYSLIRVKPKNAYTDYEITVMNGNLEKLLYGNHVIKEINDHLEVDSIDTNEQDLLKSAIAEALSKFIQVPIKWMAKNELPMLASERNELMPALELSA